MPDDLDEALAVIRDIRSVDDVAELQRLQVAVEQLAATHVWPASTARTLFDLYERFPDENAYGLFWSVLHLAERLPDYPREMVASLRRRPTEFPLTMANDLLNAGVRSVAGDSLLDLLGEVSDRADLPAWLRQDARDCADRHAHATADGDVPRSPLDAGSLALDPPITLDDILQAIRDGRERA